MTTNVINEYFPDEVSHPGLTLEDVLEEKGMTQAELATRTGRPKKTINEIIKGRTAITAETALHFERALGIPASFWNSRQNLFDEYIARKDEDTLLKPQINWLKKFPVNDMVKHGWINRHSNDILQLKELLMYFGVNSPDDWTQLWMNPAVVFRQSPVFTRQPEATSSWLRKGELESQKINCSIYDKNIFSDSLKEILPLTRNDPSGFKNIIVDLCAKSGVAVVFIPPLKGVPVYGVTRWLSPTKALIQLSLRGRYEDKFWFTFFHEAGHILLHGKKDMYIEGSSDITDKENEANSFAKDFMISSASWYNFAYPKRIYSGMEIVDFANKINISPAIVVGRLQHERLIRPSLFNKLRRRYVFPGQEK